MSDTGSTHWDGCYQHSGHQQCALELVERLRARVECEANAAKDHRAEIAMLKEVIRKERARVAELERQRDRAYLAIREGVEDDAITARLRCDEADADGDDWAAALDAAMADEQP